MLLISLDFCYQLQFCPQNVRHSATAIEIHCAHQKAYLIRKWPPFFNGNGYFFQQCRLYQTSFMAICEIDVCLEKRQIFSLPGQKVSTPQILHIVCIDTTDFLSMSLEGKSLTKMTSKIFEILVLQDLVHVFMKMDQILNL